MRDQAQRMQPFHLTGEHAEEDMGLHPGPDLTPDRALPTGVISYMPNPKICSQRDSVWSSCEINQL
ncbi:MAG: hypothetical protein OXC91_14875, partial [Rhodobacteraceae bacterium]|nr:hypothetical protein [Paracoccaceae bacterium]